MQAREKKFLPPREKEREMCHDDHEQHNFFSSRFETQILQISVTKERKSVKDAYNNDKLSYRRSG